MPLILRTNRAGRDTRSQKADHIESLTALASSNIDMRTVESELTSTLREILTLIQKVRLCEQQ
jgi:hypothetical protein